jgi:hypothetical protein
LVALVSVVVVVVVVVVLAVSGMRSRVAGFLAPPAELVVISNAPVLHDPSALAFSFARAAAAGDGCSVLAAPAFMAAWRSRSR